MVFQSQSRMPIPRILCAAVIVFLSILALKFFPRYAIYRRHEFLALAIAIPALCASFLPKLSKIPSTIGAAIMRPSAKAFGVIVFAAGAILYTVLAFVLFEGTPVLDDDASAFFQSRIFHSGHLTVPAPQPPLFFYQFAIISRCHNVDWLCSMYPIGHPLVLLPGVALGIPWLTMPLFAAGTCALTAAVARLIFSERTARLAAITCLTSPMVAELGSTYLNHAPTAFGILLAAWGVLSCLNIHDVGGKVSLSHGLLAGLGISLAFLCRPADTFACGIVIGIVAMTHPDKAWKARWPFIVAIIILAMAVILHLSWTQVQTGDWRVPGHAFCMGKCGKYGFTPDFGPGKAVYHAYLRSVEFGAKATGWPVPVFLTALIPLTFRDKRGMAVWLWLFFIGLSTVYFFYFWYEHCFPARYLFVSVPMMIILASAGWEAIADAYSFPLSKVVLVPALLGVLLFLPLHLSSFDDHWYDIERHLPKVIAKSGIHNAVVIYDEIEYARDRDDRVNKYYASAFIRNALDFNGDIVYVHNLRSENSKLPRLFPGRKIYLYRFWRTTNKVELYREDFNPVTGEPSHTFLKIDAPHYVTPGKDRMSIPTAPIETP